MKRYIIAFMAFAVLLIGCSPARSQNAGLYDEEANSDVLETIASEDLMEIKATPPAQSGANTDQSAVGQAQSAQVTPVITAAPGNTQDATMDPTPTATPTPRPSYLLTNVSNERGYVKSSGVNLREGPGTSYPVIDVIQSNTTLVITGKTEEWYRVKISDVVGFILKEFIGLGNVPTPTPKPTPTPTPKPKASSTPSIKQGEKENYSDDDVYLAAKLIYAEGKNQSTESFLAMANVLYNRVNSSKFGGTVTKEVYRSGQFSVVSYSSFEGLKPSSAALKAARQVFNEGKRVLPLGVMYFRSSKLGKNWSSSRKFYKTIGGNNYYY